MKTNFPLYLAGFIIDNEIELDKNKVKDAIMKRAEEKKIFDIVNNIVLMGYNANSNEIKKALNFSRILFIDPIDVEIFNYLIDYIIHKIENKKITKNNINSKKWADRMFTKSNLIEAAFVEIDGLDFNSQNAAFNTIIDCIKIIKEKDGIKDTISSFNGFLVRSNFCNCIFGINNFNEKKLPSCLFSNFDGLQNKLLTAFAILVFDVERTNNILLQPEEIKIYILKILLSIVKEEKNIQI